MWHDFTRISACDSFLPKSNQIRFGIKQSQGETFLITQFLCGESQEGQFPLSWYWSNSISLMGATDSQSDEAGIKGGNSEPVQRIPSSKVEYG